jgi:hypothetical protein
MVRKSGRKARIRRGASAAPEPILVRCLLRLPKRKADRVLPHLGLAFGCGGAVLRRKGSQVEVESVLEIRTVGAIVEKGVPVLVTERIPVAPVPPDELVANAAAWFRHVRRLR